MTTYPARPWIVAALPVVWTLCSWPMSRRRYHPEDSGGTESRRAIPIYLLDQQHHGCDLDRHRHL